MPARLRGSTIGGIDLAISSYSKHKDDAFSAILCLRNRENQLLASAVNGEPPTITDLYTDPAFTKNYPMAEAIRSSLLSASVRPKTPAYQNVSIDISHAVSPPKNIKPVATANSIKNGIADALNDKGVIP